MDNEKKVYRRNTVAGLITSQNQKQGDATKVYEETSRFYNEEIRKHRHLIKTLAEGKEPSKEKIEDFLKGSKERCWNFQFKEFVNPIHELEKAKLRNKHEEEMEELLERQASEY